MISSKLKKTLYTDLDLNLPSITSEKDKNNIVEENGVWQVIIGKHFLAYLSHSMLINFYILNSKK